MTEASHDDDSPKAEEHDPSLAEISARRLAARTQWQRALARAKERFTPANVSSEMADRAAETIGQAADKTAAFAWAHRGKIALAGLLGGLFLARKPIAKAAVPLASKAKESLGQAAQAFKDRKKG